MTEKAMVKMAVDVIDGGPSALREGFRVQYLVLDAQNSAPSCTGWGEVTLTPEEVKTLEEGGVVTRYQE